MIEWLIDDDDDDFLEQLVEWIWQGKPKYSEETCPAATLSATKSHMTTRSRTSDRSGGKSETNRLSYGAAETAVSQLNARRPDSRQV
jgi:hypothetical protein